MPDKKNSGNQKSLTEGALVVSGTGLVYLQDDRRTIIVLPAESGQHAVTKLLVDQETEGDEPGATLYQR